MKGGRCCWMCWLVTRRAQGCCRAGQVSTCACQVLLSSVVVEMCTTCTMYTCAKRGPSQIHMAACGAARHAHARIRDVRLCAAHSSQG
jgi:hypothetical protein